MQHRFPSRQISETVLAHFGTGFEILSGIGRTQCGAVLKRAVCRILEWQPCPQMHHVSDAQRYVFDGSDRTLTHAQCLAWRHSQDKPL